MLAYHIWTYIASDSSLKLIECGDKLALQPEVSALLPATTKMLGAETQAKQAPLCCFTGRC
jgi:hypothetical protein